MIERAKKGFYFYQRAMWYFQIALGEIRKPLALWNETALITIWLASVLGYRPPVMWIAGAYVTASICGIVIGKILVATGVVAYNAKLSNQQSPELLEILQRVKNIEQKNG